MNSVFRRTSAAISQTTYRKVIQGAVDQMDIGGKQMHFHALRTLSALLSL